MARSRNLKPSFFSNEVLAQVTPLCRLLFAGLWTLADASGRLEDRSFRIKAELFPYDRCNVEKMLEQLQQKGFIIRYQNQAEKYIQIVNFNKHQRPHPKEAKSLIPAPEKPCNSTAQPGISGASKPIPSSVSFPSSNPLILQSDVCGSKDAGEHTSGQARGEETTDLARALKLISERWANSGTPPILMADDEEDLRVFLGLYGEPKTLAMIDLFSQVCDKWTRTNLGLSMRGLKHERNKVLEDERLKIIEAKYAGEISKESAALLPKMKTTADV